MIRLLSRISVPPERARETFTEIDAWPDWMPGLQSLEVRERHQDRLVVHAVQHQMGYNWSQLQEITMTREGLRQRQLQGKFRRWDAEWRFLLPPDGRGATVSLSLDIDLGFMGKLIPGRTLQRFFDDLFEQIVRKIESRSATEERPEAEEPDAILRVTKTLRGLEIELAGERYLLRPSR